MPVSDPYPPGPKDEPAHPTGHLGVDRGDVMHPDLLEVMDRMRRHLGHLHAAQAEAAAVMLRRTRTVRDRLIAAEDGGATLRLLLATGHEVVGRVEVGADHVSVYAGDRVHVVSLAAIVQVTS